MFVRLSFATFAILASMAKEVDAGTNRRQLRAGRNTRRQLKAGKNTKNSKAPKDGLLLPDLTPLPDPPVPPGPEPTPDPPVPPGPDPTPVPPVPPGPDPTPVPPSPPGSDLIADGYGMVVANPCDLLGMTVGQEYEVTIELDYGMAIDCETNQVVEYGTAPIGCNGGLCRRVMTERFNEEGSVRSFVDSLGYEVDLQTGRGERENVLSKKDCEGLMSLVDAGTDDVEYRFKDYQQYINETELVSIIGKDKFDNLLDLHREVVGATIPLESIKIRHMKGNTNSNGYIEYHTDESGHQYGTRLSTVIVALNENSSVQGGELYYLQEDGPVLAVREQGKAFAHSYDVVHGVAPHVGDRVSLILHFNHDLNLEDVVGIDLTEETSRQRGLRHQVR